MGGQVIIGSRTPILRIPHWITPDVITGGFVTGHLVAGGDLLSHETRLLDNIENTLGVPERALLNSFFISDSGISELFSWLELGTYEISVPEEGALLVVAYLMKQGNLEEARLLLEEIRPFFSTLRFYPVKANSSLKLPDDTKVHLRNVGQVIASLNTVKASEQILAQLEAITVWIPLYDSIVALFLETVDGDRPNINVDGSLGVGEPSSLVSDDWKIRGQALLSSYSSLRQQYPRCTKPDKTKGSFYQVRRLLGLFLDPIESVSRRDLQRLRELLARYVAKRGVPGSHLWRESRQAQMRQVEGVTYDVIAKTLTERLSHYPYEEGIEDLAPILDNFRVLVEYPMLCHRIFRLRSDLRITIRLSL